MDRLLEIGFKRFGHWEIENGRLRYRLTERPNWPNCLYAFVVDRSVLYVGKTAVTLATRMNGYAAPGPSQSTNARANRNIRRLADDGSMVEILARPDEGLMSFGSFKLNLAAALEDSIIRELNPPWNGGRSDALNYRSERVAVSPPTEKKFMGHSGGPSFRITLHPTYAKQGFFNVGLANSKWFGADGETVEIYFKNEDHTIIGVINRRATSDDSVRLMGRTALRDWFRSNVGTMDTFEVTVIAPTAIRISPVSRLHAVMPAR